MATAGASSAAAASKIKEQRAKVAQLELALRETELRAPYDGVVTAINFEPGATAHTGDSAVHDASARGSLWTAAAPWWRTSTSGRSRRNRPYLDGREVRATMLADGRDTP